MNMQQFKTHIRSVTIEELDTYFDQISAKLDRARNPQIIAGYAIALDELVIEKGMRKYDTDKYNELTLDEILEELEY